jgi:3-oxoacid CoA-transferase subunit A
MPAAVALVSTASIMMGGFGVCGIPENPIRALRARLKRLTVISNNAGVDDFGAGVLLRARQVKKMISTYVGENKELRIPERRARGRAGAAGTFSERMRAAGAGIAGFFTDGLRHHRGRGQGDPDDRRQGVRARAAAAPDFAFVKAWKGDRLGNLVYGARRETSIP